MDRRRFIGAALATTSLVCALSREGTAAPGKSLPTVLRLGLSNGRSSTTGKMAVSLAQYVADKCNGRLRVDIYPNNEAGGELELTQDLVAGAIDIVLTSSVGYASPNVAPQLGIFDVPFLFRNIQHARAVLDGHIGDAAIQEMRSINVIGLAWGENGVRHITTSQKPVRSPQDLAGLKIRVPQSDVMVKGFKALGADPAPLPFPDVYAALADGSFQAQENPVANIKASSLDQVQKYLCLTGHVYSPCAVLMAQRVFDALPTDDQEVLKTAARQAVNVSRAASDAGQQADIDELRKRGMIVVEDIDRVAFLREIAKADTDFERMFGKQRLDAIRAFGR